MEIVLPAGRLPDIVNSSWFGVEGPLIIEIGIGSGHFLANLAERRPGARLLGIDISPTSVARSHRKLALCAATHARLVKADARLVLRDFLPERSIDSIYVNFPDPWPRKKHRHKRLLQQSFFRLASTRLRQDGAIMLTTDQSPYLDEAIAEADASGCFRVEVGSPPPLTLATKYAAKWAHRGRTFHHAAFRKTAESTPVPSSYRAVDVHHAVLTGALPDLGPSILNGTFDEGRVIIKDVCRPVGRDELVFLIHTEEDMLSQEVLIQVKPGRDGYFVGLRRFGEPLPTRGIARAVDVVVQVLEENGMAVRHRKY